MSRPLRKLTFHEAVKKARAASLDELRVRGTQAAAAWVERVGVSVRTRVPSDAAFIARAVMSDQRATARSLLDEFRTSGATALFGGLNDRRATVDELRKRWPDAEAGIVRAADALLAGRFELLSRSSLDFGDPIDWRLDPSSGKRTPLVHWTLIDPLSADSAGEYKLTWEVNRHQHFITLGQACWLTGDERYAAAMVDQLTGWMQANPPNLGINWASSLELSYRVISWIWGLEYIRDSDLLTPNVFLQALKFLYLQGRHIETFLSTYYSPNTHLTGEALGLMYLGTFLPSLRCAGRWRRLGQRILRDQLDRQVRADGVYFEQATYYHRYTVDIYTHFRILACSSHYEADGIDGALKLALDFLVHAMRPDGTTPLIGDDDAGRVIRLDRRAPNDFRAALANGAVLYRRGDYRFAAQEASEETLWLFGPRGLEQFDQLAPAAPAATARGFADGGYYVARDGWHRRANYVLVDCGPHGTLNCGHAHADALALEVAVSGRAMIVDPGTFTYTASAEERDHFRLSPAHNTVCVDGASSSVAGGPFQWAEIARCTAHAWLATDRFVFFQGSHDGYQRLVSPAVHTRALLFLKGDYWILRDRVSSDGPHRVELCFQLAQGAAVRAAGHEAVAVLGDAQLVFASLAAAGDFRIEPGAVCDCYGHRAVAPRLVFDTAGTGQQEIVTFLFPAASADPMPVVCELSCTAGRAFRIRGPSWSDIIVLGDSALAAAAGVRSDFAWTWVRRTADTQQPVAAIGIDGSRITVDGSLLVACERPVAFAVMPSGAHHAPHAGI